MDHHQVSIEEVARVVYGMGSEAFSKLAGQLPKVGVKFGWQTLGHFELFLNQLNPEEREAVIRGDRKLTTEEVIRLLIDQNGRGIPAHLGIKSDAKDENAIFTIKQLTNNYGEIRDSYVEAFADFPELKFLSASEFEDRSEKKKEMLLADGLISNLVRRAHMPIPTPYFVVNDYGKGKALQEIFLAVLEKMYKKHFPDRNFENYNVELKKKVRIIKNTGYDKFIAMMASGPDAVWYFPRALQGFSINAEREAMKILIGRSLALSGAISTSLAITGNVVEMVGSFNTPGYDCAAVSWESSDFSLYFEASGDELEFDGTDDLGGAHDDYSAGLVFLG